MSEEEKLKIEEAQRVDTDRIFTLPNLLSILRLLLIPLIIYLYETQHYVWAFGMLLFSGVTDVVDGWIARTFHLVTDFGKAIDPIADKLTQVAVLLCLLKPGSWWIVGVLVFKEITIGAMSLAAIRRTHSVYSAGWYGKLCTVVIYLSMFAIILWRNPPELFLWIDAGLIVASVLLAFVKYFLYFIRILRQSGAAAPRNEQ